MLLRGLPKCEVPNSGFWRVLGGGECQRWGECKRWGEGWRVAALVCRVKDGGGIAGKRSGDTMRWGWASGGAVTSIDTEPSNPAALEEQPVLPGPPPGKVRNGLRGLGEVPLLRALHAEELGSAGGCCGMWGVEPGHGLVGTEAVVLLPATEGGATVGFCGTCPRHDVKSTDAAPTLPAEAVPCIACSARTASRPKADAAKEPCRDTVGFPRKSVFCGAWRHCTVACAGDAVGVELGASLDPWQLPARCDTTGGGAAADFTARGCSGGEEGPAPQLLPLAPLVQLLPSPVAAARAGKATGTGQGPVVPSCTDWRSGAAKRGETALSGGTSTTVYAPETCVRSVELLRQVVDMPTRCITAFCLPCCSSRLLAK